ncbi:TlpA family protein disulfide reductase [Anaerosporobacter faecicola]|uniref:TlpA family protein disulfide reductase n=1 Tax=Anaerosporobacter faecicola TaxID=2718714 RepID=UPI001439C113|nr:TlpA disulfide reductase family protein [Anaerosporobacter faecicola]
MNKYMKLLIGIILFILVILGIRFLYQYLSNTYKTGQILITEQEAQVNDKESGTDDGENEKTEDIQAIMDFTVVDGKETEIKLSSFLGKPIVVNFWASWCTPCKYEMPDFQEAYEKYGSEVEFVMVNLTDGSSETMDSANEFLETKEYTFPVYYDTKQEAASVYSVYSIPTTYFLDENGRIVANAQGMLDMETLEKGISMIK